MYENAVNFLIFIQVFQCSHNPESHVESYNLAPLWMCGALVNVKQRLALSFAIQLSSRPLVSSAPFKYSKLILPSAPRPLSDINKVIKRMNFLKHIFLEG